MKGTQETYPFPGADKREPENRTVFQKTEITEPALFSPSDTTKPIENFPEICVSTFSQNIIENFSTLKNVEKISELYTANGVIPVYKICYRNTNIAFYLSRVGAPACVVGFEEIRSYGSEEICIIWLLRRVG